jgi:hypothetical protein
MLEPVKVPGEMVRFMKASWETYLRIMETIQAQTEKILEVMLTQSSAVQDEGKQMIKQWTEMMKEAQAQYKKIMEENLSKLESMINKE